MRFMRLAMVALFAVFAFSAMAAGSASAVGHPLFVTASGKNLSFTGTSGLGVLRAEKFGAVGTIDCEKDSSSGEIINKSTLARKVAVSFSGKCTLTTSAGSNKCKEPISIKTSFGELGLLSSTNKKVLLLLAPESGTEFVTVECEGNKTKVSGAIIGEFPENNAHGEKQINVSRSSFELVFNANKSQNQAITEIFLLGSQMTKVELKVEEFLGGKASEETTEVLTPDGAGEITTKE